VGFVESPHCQVSSVDNPAVSIIMAVYNGEKYLSQAIESILEQTYPDFEFIIVDDSSTDETINICDKYDLQDPRIKLLKNQQNQGLTYSLNKAWKTSSGNYIARMDADDISLPNRLEIQVRYLENHPEVGLMGTFYQEIDNSGQVSQQTIRFPTEPIIIKWRLCFENPIPHPMIIMRRSVFEQVGGYDEAWKTSQDYDLFTRLSRITKLANYPEVLYYWRVHENSISSGHNSEQRENALRISQKYMSVLLKEPMSSEVVHSLWNREKGDFKVTLQRAYHLYHLCRQILSEPLWTRAEKKRLRAYVTQKLFSYVRPYIREFEIWKFLPYLVFLSPSQFYDLIKTKVKKTLAPQI
jgi:glycosyltransferase involved in cell wall biosynthesis